MKKEYKSPQMKILIATFRNHLAIESLVVGSDVVPIQGAKDGSIYGFEDNEYNYPNKVNVWK